jgi:DNA-binding transcriptional LysR family regulator
MARRAQEAKERPAGRPRQPSQRRELQFARNLDWNLLKTYFEIVQAKGITNAAQELSRKQPAVSLALRRLEDRMGVVLCRRGSTGFELTDEGQVLAETCSRLMEQVREIPYRMSDLNSELKGHVRVRLVSNLVAPELDAAIAAFHQKYPSVEIIVEVSTWIEIVNALIQHKVDIGLAPTRTKRAELNYRYLFTEVHRVYCGRLHQLFGKADVGFDQLRDEGFILTGADEDDELTKFRLLHGIGRNVAGVSEHLEEARRLAILGVGLCLLPEQLAQQDVEAGKLWPLVAGDDVPRTDVYIITDPGASHHIARDLLIQEMTDRTRSSATARP